MIPRGERVVLRVDLDEGISGSSGGMSIGQESNPDFSDGPISAQDTGEKEEGEQRGAGWQGVEGVIALLLHSVLAAADDDAAAAPSPCSTTTPLVVQEPSLQSNKPVEEGGTSPETPQGVNELESSSSIVRMKRLQVAWRRA